MTDDKTGISTNCLPSYGELDLQEFLEQRVALIK